MKLDEINALFIVSIYIIFFYSEAQQFTWTRSFFNILGNFTINYAERTDSHIYTAGFFKMPIKFLVDVFCLFTRLFFLGVFL